MALLGVILVLKSDRFIYIIQGILNSSIVYICYLQVNNVLGDIQYSDIDLWLPDSVKVLNDETLSCMKASVDCYVAIVFSSVGKIKHENENMKQVDIGHKN